MNIVLSGSIAFDYLMSFPGHFKEHILPEKLDSISLSFLVDSMVKQPGGVAPNISYTLALLGLIPRIMATVGEDFEEYRRQLEHDGIDTSAIKVIPDVFTASFFCNTDRENAQIASFYPGAMAFAGQLSFRNLEGDVPDLVLISPNAPEAMVKYASECQELEIPYLYDPSQQIPRLTGSDLRNGVEGALALFVNDYEFSLIQKATGMSEDNILASSKFTVVTRGHDGATIYVQDGQIHIPVVPPRTIVDPTGVGDAFRGGFLAGYSHGLDWVTCGQMGALAATYCLEQQGPQNHSFTKDEFIHRYRSHFDDQGKLDAILS
jgi:adenosine kinase